MARKDLATVEELLGHKDIRMTRTYAHLSPDYKRQAVSILDEMRNKLHKNFTISYPDIQEISQNP